jgi:predicted lipase
MGLKKVILNYDTMSEYITKQEAKEMIENMHVCYQAEKIGQMHKVLLGNGEPEKSMVSQMLLINERLEEIRKSRANVMPIIFNIIMSIGVIAAIYFGYKELSKIQDEARMTNEILAPYGRTRGITIDTLK